MDATTKKKERTTPEPVIHHGRSFSWFACPFLALFLYALSIGPVARLCHFAPGTYQPRTQKFVETFYKPIFFAAEVSPPVRRSIIWYVSIWTAPP